MPELPEVQTTVNGLNKVLKNHVITDVWTDYYVRTTNKRTDTIKNKKFFEKFRKELIGEKFLRSERRGKNVLIHFSHNKTVLIHMKMTGHLLYGKYERLRIENGPARFESRSDSGGKLRIREKKETNKEVWRSEEKNLKDPFNQFIHFLIQFKNGTSLAFSDMRKFAKVTLIQTDVLREHTDIKMLGPEANDKKLNWKLFKKQLLKRPKGKVKTVLMDQSVVAGIGNIYSDEILWASGVHPERAVETLTDQNIRTMLWQAVRILAHSIDVGGDSMSDYRNIYGKRGGYQNSHKAYRRTKQNCLKRGCRGVILRKVIGGRSAHFCSVHQK